jgi:hypothetical protein
MYFYYDIDMSILLIANKATLKSKQILHRSPLVLVLHLVTSQPISLITITNNDSTLNLKKLNRI